MFKVENYVVEPDFGQKASKYSELGALLRTEDIGFEFSENSKITEYTVRPANNKGDIINTGAYSIDGIFIIASQAFKQNDKTPKDDPSRAPNNEMTWQAFLKAASKRNTKNLKGMILRDIQNKGTWEILRQGYEARNIPLNKHATWELDSGDQEMVKWFKRLVGSDNIGGKLLHNDQSPYRHWKQANQEDNDLPSANWETNRRKVDDSPYTWLIIRILASLVCRSVLKEI